MISVVVVLGAMLLALSLWSSCNRERQQANELGKLIGEMKPVVDATEQLRAAMARGVSQGEFLEYFKRLDNSISNLNRPTVANEKATALYETAITMRERIHGTSQRAVERLSIARGDDEINRATAQAAQDMSATFQNTTAQFLTEYDKFKAEYERAQVK
jgi:hypothetical protein